MNVKQNSDRRWDGVLPRPNNHCTQPGSAAPFTAVSRDYHSCIAAAWDQIPEAGKSGDLVWLRPTSWSEILVTVDVEGHDAVAARVAQQVDRILQSLDHTAAAHELFPLL